MRKSREEMNKGRDALTHAIIGAAIEVHREFGPGLLESVYENALCCELEICKIPFARQVKIPLLYKNRKLEADFRLDIVVEEKVILEIKAVDQLLPIHEAQVITYMKLTGIPTCLLMNFNVRVLKDGINRVLL